MKLRGFSLVELSIVLVILGLLTGGILAGQSLIRASELRAVTVERNRYITAAQAFHDKYFAIPGDFGGATQVWTGVTNGNGDGRLGYGSNAQKLEMPGFWQQLGLAGLIEGSYTGALDSNSGLTPGLNIPRSKLSPAGWSAWAASMPFDVSYAGHCEMLMMDYGNALGFGSLRAGYWAMTPVLRPAEAWNIDQKIDDGDPTNGSVVAVLQAGVSTCLIGTASTCTTTGGPLPTDFTGYNLSNKSVVCALASRRAF